MKRPVLFASLSFIGGIILGRYISKVEYIALVLLAIFFCAFVAKRKARTDFVFALPIFMILGILVFNLNIKALPKYEEKVYVRGCVKEASMSKNGKQSLVLKADEISCKKIEKVDYTIKVFMPKDVFVKQGDMVVIGGRLDIAEMPSNDGGFDNFTYMKSNGYDYNLSADKITKYGEEKLTPYQKIIVLRGKINNVFDLIYPSEEAGIIKAMVTGSTEVIDEDIRNLYAHSGISHVLAVSGLHTAIVAGIVLWLFDAFKINRRKSAIITIGILTLYLFFVGAKIAATRAVIMVCVMLFGRIVYRLSDTLSSMSLAAMIILTINPWQLWDVGFQLSFISVISLVCVGNAIINNRSLWKKIRESLRISFIVSLATLPIVAWNFYQVPLLGCFVNIFILPLVGLVVGFGMLSGFVGLFNINAAIICGGPAYIILKFYEEVCRFFTSLPFSTVLIGRPPLLAVIIFYGILISIYFINSENIKTYIMPILLNIMLVILLISNITCFKINSVDFIDVGQGDCAIIRTWDNKAYIIDTGGYINKNNLNSENTGVKVIIPYLKSHGIKEVDAMFLSHMDSDHILGATEIITDYKVKKIFTSNYNWDNREAYLKIKEEAEKRNVIVEPLQIGMEATLGEDIKINCLYPFRRKIVEDSNDNNGSLVLKLSIGENSFLFTGDIEKIDEKIMLFAGENLEADVLKVAHHGSEHSSGSEFLEAVNMKYAVISSGKRNVYGHPSEQTLDRIKATNAQIYNTAQCGTISFKTNGKKLWVKTKKEVADGEALE